MSHPLTLCIESLKKPQKNKSVITQLRSVLEGSRYRKLPLKETALSVLMLARRNYAIDPALDGILIVASLLGGSLIQKFVDVSSGTGRLDAIIHELQKSTAAIRWSRAMNLTSLQSNSRPLRSGRLNPNRLR